jgi:thiamine biosynthesis lipoprotein ApbE
VASIPLASGALSVSCDALAAFDDGGTQRGHHVDPQTGAPAEAGRLAWVLAGSGAASDALGTALLLRGPSLPAVPGASGGWVSGAGAAPSPWPAQPAHP